MLTKRNPRKPNITILFDAEGLQKAVETFRKELEYYQSTRPHCPDCGSLLDLENYCVNVDCRFYTEAVVIIDL